MRKTFLIVVLYAISGSSLPAQRLPGHLQANAAFCDANLTEDQTDRLRRELNSLEKHLIGGGLLKDHSGASYREVYELIAEDNDLIFEIDTSFTLLDSLDFRTYTRCFYKVLTPGQLAQITERHLEIADRIASHQEGSSSSGTVARRILDNLTEEDFELEYYRVSSLLIFYRTATPGLPIGLLPSFKKEGEELAIETTGVVLHEKNQLLVDNKELTGNEVERLIYEYLREEPSKKGIEISAFRGASYESYVGLLEVVNSVYSTLRDEMCQQKFGRSFVDASEAHRKEVEKLIPTNIIFNEPK